MRKALGVSLLVMLLALSARAGVIPNGSEPPPPPPESITQGGSAAPSDGIIQTGNADALTEAVLSALNTVLSLA